MRRAGRDGNGGEETALWLADAVPGPPAIISDERVGEDGVGLLIVAPDSHPVQCALEHQRKDPRRCIGWPDGGVEDAPGFTEIRGPEDAGDGRAAGGEPGSVRAFDSESGVAGSEGA